MVKGVFDEKSPSKGNSFEGNFIWLKMNYLVLIFAVSATFKKSIKSRKTAWLGGFRGGQRWILLSTIEKIRIAVPKIYFGLERR